jgi:hypothetical protein
LTSLSPLIIQFLIFLTRIPVSLRLLGIFITHVNTLLKLRHPVAKNRIQCRFWNAHQNFLNRIQCHPPSRSLTWRSRQNSDGTRSGESGSTRVSF